MSSYENSRNPSPDRQGGVGPADCFNRSLTVAARYRIFMPCGAALSGMGNSRESPLWGGAESVAFGVGPSASGQPTPAPPGEGVKSNVYFPLTPTGREGGSDREWAW